MSSANCELKFHMYYFVSLYPAALKVQFHTYYDFSQNPQSAAQKVALALSSAGRLLSEVASHPVSTQTSEV
jgi:hypothetical protein